jgi:putative hydrolase of the HAD superfamily
VAEDSGAIEAVICDFGGVLTTPLIQSFMAFQDHTGISTELLGKGMQAATEANGGENPLFEMERGEISEVAFLDRLTDSLEPLLSGTARRCTASKRSTSKRSTPTRR